MGFQTDSPPYTRHELVGKGASGTVYKGIHNSTHQAVAIKVLNLDTQVDEVNDIRQEVQLLKELTENGEGRNINRYHGCWLVGTRLWIVMDYCFGGSIRTVLQSGPLPELHISIITRELLHALSYIHSLPLIHRDLKCANILLTHTGSIQLCDFGVAAPLTSSQSKRSTFVGTPYWMAPEVIREGEWYDVKADIWSAGVCVYEMATGNPPFADQEPMRAVFLIPRSPPSRLEGNFSAQIKEFVALCVSEIPGERPSAEDLLKTKFIKNSAKTGTGILKELITRYKKWEAKGEFWVRGAGGGGGWWWWCGGLGVRYG
ncbi:kinase-like protein [Saitoella complicata NRRL Y-17804]|uniref:kinase-like protein n=1 Tax=Saitoella complicata (strain BCRC 22490 / CBS 7301 / JCM 7358 / NBRC 10748 / NRRL Y-17804) TaxID=698492 RepID=UPI000867CB91|nr:kinase-like protein [Saitoella complicata NRRL Y-17804]ODQ55531.1 kinase-like protein [Saitoella complicata NRRL Y-17804]